MDSPSQLPSSSSSSSSNSSSNATHLDSCNQPSCRLLGKTESTRSVVQPTKAVLFERTIVAGWFFNGRMTDHCPRPPRGPQLHRWRTAAAVWKRTAAMTSSCSLMQQPASLVRKKLLGLSVWIKRNQFYFYKMQNSGNVSDVCSDFIVSLFQTWGRSLNRF